MQRRWKASIAAGGALVALVATAVTGVALAGNEQSPRPVSRPVLERTVTLVTGDRVTVDDAGRLVGTQAGPGRAGVTFVSGTERGHLRVVPSDAGALLGAGRLDPRLFDITGLLADGFDRRDHLPLILAGGKSLAAVAGGAGLARQRDLPAVNAVAVRQPRGSAADSWRELTGGASSPRTLKNSVDKVWLDGIRRPVLDVSVAQIGAPVAWQAGFTGAGTTVAVLDTGIDDTHPDLAGQVAGRQNFTDGYEPDADLSGHGTHVAATIAGRKGVAPGAKLLDGKVCVVGGCAESWILAGMTWAAEQHAKIVNLSFGAPDDPAVVDPVEEAVQALSERYGTLFVVAAGNADGVTEGAIDSPGTVPAALTVGAVNDRDELATFSRRGPGPQGALKPELTAPGVDITAARGKDATDVPGAPGDPYTTLSGTSMATPHVAGAAAILAQQHADWSGPALKAALMAAAQPNPAYGAYAQGAGRVDVGRAVRQSVTSTTPGIGFGEQRWPHTDDEVRTAAVSYHNSGTADVTLTLGLERAASVFTVSPGTLVVPAGGDARATVTADTRSGPDGNLGGWVTATAGDQVVRVPVAVVKEVESYDVTLVHTDRNGAAPASFWTTLFKRDDPFYQAGGFGPDPASTMTVRVPAGHYTLASTVETGVTSTTVLVQPDLAVTKALTVNLDARLGRPVSVTLPDPSAKQVSATVAVYTRRPGGSAGRVVGGGSFAGLFVARLGPDRRTDGFMSYVDGQWTAGPDLYALMYPQRDRMLNGFQHRVVDGELARVRVDTATTGAASSGLRRVRVGIADWDVGDFGPYLPIGLPSTRTEHLNAEPGVHWAGDLVELVDDETSTYTADETYSVYQAGRGYERRWNRGVFGPRLGRPNGLWDGVTRTGNQLTVGVARFGDGAGRPGDGPTLVRTTALYRDGTRIADQGGTVDVPAGEAAYRLELNTERGAPFELSTKTGAVWTFRSGHVDALTPLPLWDIRFTPELDRRNAALPGRTCAVPVTVTPQAGSSPGRPGAVSVEVSFDDGATWRAAPVRDGAATVTHPTGHGFVSLRAKVADSAGNTAEQTVIHAYRY